MRQCLLYCVVSVFCFLLIGCRAPSKKEITEASDRKRITSENMNRIAWITWTLEKMTVDGKEYSLAGERPYMQIGMDGKVFGSGSVNKYFVSVIIDRDGDLQWSPIGSTKMAGPEDMMKQEHAYFNALPMTEQMWAKENHLYMSTKDKQIELVFYVPVQ